MDIHSDKLKLDWRFPLPKTHDGILLGNGLFGVAVWGDERLCLTINRADFWDRRNIRPITAKMNLADLRKHWLARDVDGITQLVDPEDSSIGIGNPSGLPMGRIELGLRIAGATLQMADGALCLCSEEADTTLRLSVDADQPVLLIESDNADLELSRRPAWDFMADTLASLDHAPPQMFDDGPMCGWTHELPDGPTLCLAYGRFSTGLAVTAVYGETAAAARANAGDMLGNVGAAELESTKRWWNGYWQQIPQIDLPSKEAEEVYYYGLFKLVGMSKEYPAVLQGPWVEEYQMPDCSNDFHFNVNIQMCYWPAYGANAPELLQALFDRLKQWEPRLRNNAKLLFDIDDGIFLPMSVSDTGEWNGSYWPSFTDYSCTGWAAHLMWLYYRYTMDADFLRDTAYPFMKGAMRVYESLLEEEDGQMILPFGTSAEYNWGTFEAAGRNPSFQLACIHFLLESLISSAELLDIDADDVTTWKQLQQTVPPYAEYIQPADQVVPWSPSSDELATQPRIAVYEGQDLELSHRHHGHLAVVHPFDTLGPEHAIVRPTLYRWLEAGQGTWIAFSFTWAAIIYCRMRDGEAAYLNYDLWYRLFTNKYRGAIELTPYTGISTWVADEDASPMQMDAIMGAVNAIQEMLLQTVRGTMRVFPAIPRIWQHAVSFEKMRAEGAFLVSAEMKENQVISIEIISEKGAELRLANNIADEIVVSRGGKEERTRTKLLTLQTVPGEIITITGCLP